MEYILLDSVFIMDLFLRKANKSEQKMTTCSPYHESRRSYEGICCCLKNQLPMFVLDELHKRNVLGDNGSNKENCVGFVELALDYFKDCYPNK